MNKFNKNLSKILAIITGFGLNFGVCNTNAIDSIVNVDTKEVDFQTVLNFVEENKEALGLIKVKPSNLSGNYCYIFDKDGKILIYDSKNKTVELSDEMEKIGSVMDPECPLFIKFQPESIDLPEDENPLPKQGWLADMMLNYCSSLENGSEAQKQTFERIQNYNKIKYNFPNKLSRQNSGYTPEKPKCEQAVNNDSSDWQVYAFGFGLSAPLLYLYFGYMVPYLLGNMPVHWIKGSSSPVEDDFS